MKARVTLTLVLAFGLVNAGTAFAEGRSAPEFRPNELIVKYRQGVRRNRSMMDEIYDSARVIRVKRFNDGSQLYEQLFLEADISVSTAIAALERNSSVAYAQPNYIVRALPVTAAPAIPAGIAGTGSIAELLISGDRPAVDDRPAEVIPPVVDPELGKAWGLGKIGATKVWSRYSGLRSMVVAVIDTGVDYNHEDLSFNIWRNPKPDKKAGDLVGFDFIHNDGLPYDDYPHGSHCAGIIGAVGGNGVGISGINQRVSIMVLKFLSPDIQGDTAGAIRSIDYAVAHGAKVLSNSWAGSGASNVALSDAIKRAGDKDVLFIAAAGNYGTDNDTSPVFPASLNAPNMISVAATDLNEGLAEFSDIGATTVQVAAPGVDIYSTLPGNKYGEMSGTSMACPHVAGAAALLWSAHPAWTGARVKARLMDTVDKLPSLDGKTVTGGRINVARALGVN